jgi:uncharacterized RDD family membrane protein YckC
MATEPGVGLIGRMAGAVTGRVVDAVPPEVILDHLDLDAFLDRVDLNHLLDRVDLDRLLARIDVNAFLARVDVDSLLSDVQIAELIRRAGVPDLVAEASGRFAGSALDSARRQLVGVDTLVARFIDRLLRRRSRQPAAPATSLGPDVFHRQEVSGRYGGAASRSVAAVVDLGVILLSSAVLVGLGEYVLHAFFDVSVDPSGLAAAIALGAWAFVYTFAATTITGRTIGKALVGLVIVGPGSSPLSPPRAFVRALTFPLSTMFFGAGLLLILIHPRHRALHDLIAGTAVVYDWGDRPAELPAPLTAYLRDRNLV